LKFGVNSFGRRSFIICFILLPSKEPLQVNLEQIYFTARTSIKISLRTIDKPTFAFNESVPVRTEQNARSRWRCDSSKRDIPHSPQREPLWRRDQLNFKSNSQMAIPLPVLSQRTSRWVAAFRGRITNFSWFLRLKHHDLPIVAPPHKAGLLRPQRLQSKMMRFIGESEPSPKRRG
jgi:hypothetical protein